MNVKDIIKPAVIVRESDTFASALQAMTTQQTNTLLVTNEEGILTGEVSVVDLLSAVIPDTLDGNEVMEHFATDEAFTGSMQVVRDLPVAEFMSYDFSALQIKDNLLEVVATAIAHSRARIPVVDTENKPVGIISRQGLKQILGKYLNT